MDDEDQNDSSEVLTRTSHTAEAEDWAGSKSRRVKDAGSTESSELLIFLFFQRDLIGC